jgi:hypothetical protein
LFWLVNTWWFDTIRLGAVISLTRVPLLVLLCVQVGLAQYTLRQYDAAETSFEAVRARDPYRLSCMDTYSNILYVKVRVLSVASLFLILCAGGCGLPM